MRHNAEIGASHVDIGAISIKVAVSIIEIAFVNISLLTPSCDGEA
jgi:hypothetical protein